MKNILGSIKKNYPTFYDLLEKSNILAQLTESKFITIFAPRESAFKKVDKEVFKGVTNNPEKLTKMISLHIIPSGTLYSTDLLQLSSAKTLAGNLSIKTRDKGILLNNTSKVTKTDLKSDNGVIHEIDIVLLPKE